MVVMGHITAAFGVHGWIKIFPHGDPDKLFRTSHWWLGKNQDWREVTPLKRAHHGKVIIVQLNNCNDRDQASLLKGLQVAVPRELLPEGKIKEYDWQELIGLDVANLQGQSLGKVVGLLEARAHEVLRVVGQDKRERLLPFVETVVHDIDLGAMKITVDWGFDW